MDSGRLDAWWSPPDACGPRPCLMADLVDAILRNPRLTRAAAALYLTSCVSLLCLVSWALLTPDPFRIVRDSSMAWTEQVSDIIVHAAVFAVLSTAWLGLFQFLRRELPLLALLVMLGYCVCMESLQILVPGRHCCPKDAIANIAGFLIGLTIVRVLGQRCIAAHEASREGLT